MQTQDEAQPRDRRPWTEEEDEKLLAAIEEEDPDTNPPSRWHAIAQHIPNRTNKDCRKRWWAQMATVVSKGSWTNDEDERLFNAVEELGPKWALVASRVRTRNSGQCAKRWNDALNPSIDRSGWSREEDELLLKGVEEQGHSWANIARNCLPGRTGLAAKNRYNHLLRGSDRPAGSRSRRNTTIITSSRRRTRGASVSSPSSYSPASPQSYSATSRSSPEGSMPPSTPEPLTENDVGASGCTVEAGPVDRTKMKSGRMCQDTPSGSFSPPAGPAMEHQILDLFMSDAFADLSANSPTSLLDHVPPAGTPPILGDIEQYNLFGPWSDGVLGSATFTPSSFLDPMTGVSQQASSSVAPHFSGDILDLHGFQPAAAPEKADFLTSSSALHPQLRSPYVTPPLSDFPAFSDAQVTIGSVSSLPDHARIQVSQPNVDRSDRRIAVAVAICDRQDIGSTVQSLSHSLSTILTRGQGAGSQ
ncbi:Homeodomain-like protein [Sparassis latifolia]